MTSKVSLGAQGANEEDAGRSFTVRAPTFDQYCGAAEPLAVGRCSKQSRERPDALSQIVKLLTKELGGSV